MTRHDRCQCCEQSEGGSSGFLFGLILGLIIGVVIAVLVYRHNKGEVVQVLKKKINKFLLSLESVKSSKFKKIPKAPPKSSKTAPKTFLTR